jgi:hypothetical protein
MKAVTGLGRGRSRCGFGRKSMWARWTRRLWPLIGGIALQAAATSCDQQFNALSTDIVNGIGAGIGNLLQALILTVFV